MGSEYWQKRFQAVEDMNNKSARKTVQSIIPSFDKAQAQIEKEINAWYGRFAKNNQISLVEAKKLLNTKELKELMDEIHKEDCKLFVQLGAGFGRVMLMIDMLSGLLDKPFLAKMLKVDRVTASPSELPNVWEPKRMCPEITVQEKKN